MKSLLPLIASFAVISSASALTLYESNFDALADDLTLSDNQAIATGLVARVAANASITVEDQGGGNKALLFTDNNTSFVSPGLPLLKSTFTGLSTTSGGNNLLTGSFDLTMLATGVPFQYYIQSGNQESTGGGITIIRMEISTTNSLRYSVAGGLISSGSAIQLTVGTTYRYSYSIDLQSDTQDTWSLHVAPVNDLGNPVVNVSNQGTWQPNLTPGIAVFRVGGAATEASASPTYQLDNVSLYAVPEPSAFLLGGVFALGALMRRRRA